MKYINKMNKVGLLLAVAVMVILSSCNKDLELIPEPPYVPPPAGQALGEMIQATPNDSLYYRMMVRGNMVTTVNNRANVYTMYVPGNPAMRQFVNAASGGAIPIAAPDAVHSAFISGTLPAATATAIVSYNISPQALRTTSIPATFPNFFYPSILNPNPPLSALLRLDNYPSTRNTTVVPAWVNNIPLTTVNIQAANGIIHRAAAVMAPPSRYLWNRIDTDADLTIFKAAVQRADSGVAPTGPASLIWALSNFGPNLTVYAPNNLAMKNFISFVSGGVIPVGAPDAVFIGFIGSNNVSTQLVKGITVYHMMGVRTFTNNFPTTATSYPTLLNSAIPTHPGVALTVTFTGASVTAATVKGIANPTASNILINPTPDPGGSSDQHFVNGTLHKLDQVLIPQ